MAPEKDFTPQFQLESLALNHAAMSSFVHTVAEQFVFVDDVDTGPPLERLHALGRLLC